MTRPTAAAQDAAHLQHGDSTDRDLRHRELRDGEWWRAIPAYSDIDEATFLDHAWQRKQSVKSVADIKTTLGDLVKTSFLEDIEAGIRRAPMSVRITPYVMSLVDWAQPEVDPVRRQFLPLGSSAEPDHPWLTLDSLSEQDDSPVPGFTHRYPDKALFVVLDTCPVYCRFCTRSYAVGLDTDSVDKLALRPNPKRWQQVFDYVESCPELEDIVISGGDLANLGAKGVREIGLRLLEIEHIRRIRYATKSVAILPQKLISDEPWLDALTAVAERGRTLGKQVAVHTHFNTPHEITRHSQMAVQKLWERSIVVRNQSVLQRGVNDTEDDQVQLARKLSWINVQPYYVYMHDLVAGVEELRTTLATGIRLEKAVRGATAGFNTPTFVVDAPGGGGKRAIHSYEHYDVGTGVSVYTAPTVKPGEHFYYVDPLSQLSPKSRAEWHDELGRRRIRRRAQEAVRAHQGSSPQ